MGQKTHPIGYRLGYNYTWSSRWYAGKDYAKLLHQDIKIRKMVKAKLYHAGVAKVEIERSGDQTRVIIHTARPGIIIGRKGAEVDKLKADFEKQYWRAGVHDGEGNQEAGTGCPVGERKRRNPAGKACGLSSGHEAKCAVGASSRCPRYQDHGRGTSGGAEIARTEWYREGRVPLHTLRAEMDYGFAEAHTTMGQIGVKTWIYKGELLPAQPLKSDSALERRLG